jgi:2-oxoglutarate ferredoxin oxidoreductase subunit delta
MSTTKTDRWLVTRCRIDENGMGGGNASGGSKKGTAEMEFVHRIDCDRCKGCGLCVMVCPKDVLALSDKLNPKGYHPAYQAHPENCIHCALCCRMCPDVAITIDSVGDGKDDGKDEL